MKRGLFSRIILTYIIIAPLLLISLELYLSSVIKDGYLSNLKESLTVQARLIADEMPPASSGNLDSFCRKYKEKTQVRITIINSSGHVLGDSDEPSERMDNHSDRPEIRDAEISNIGNSIRFSKTIQQDFYYLAIAVNQNTEKRFVRLSMPLHGLKEAMNSIRIRIIAASLSSLFIAIIIGIFQTRRINKSVGQIVSFTREVKTGNFRKRLLLEEEGELGNLAVNISDMARELNARLQQSEDEKRKMEAILRNMSDGLILTDIKGNIILSNDAVKNIFGITSALEGKTIMETLRKTELMELILKVVDGRIPLSQELDLSYPGEVCLFTTAAPFYSYSSREEMTGVIILFHDITRLRKLEEVRKDFVANVSHEIKTPITAIKGFAETLLEGALYDTENARKFLETIRNHSERLNSLVSDLLTLSTIELGDIKITKSDVNLDDVIDSVFGMVRERAQRKGLYLKKEVPGDLKEINTDRNRLIQVLLNLVDNGIKYTEKGGITVRARHSNPGAPEKTDGFNLPPENLMEISVEDTGIGIPPKNLSRLGERFYRVDRARSRELGGTGLGLAIVKHLVQLLNGKMKVKSAEGVGTEVSITFGNL
jgi:two-component system phosphate regulon sensor histidine kinase PhoR